MNCELNSTNHCCGEPLSCNRDKSRQSCGDPRFCVSLKCCANGDESGMPGCRRCRFVHCKCGMCRQCRIFKYINSITEQPAIEGGRNNKMNCYNPCVFRRNNNNQKCQKPRMISTNRNLYYDFQLVDESFHLILSSES